MPKTVIAAEPIQVAGGPSLTSIEFRDPTGADFLALPSPTRQIFERVSAGAQRMEIVFDPVALKKWLIKLSGKGEEVLMCLSPRQLADVRDWLVPLLNPDGTGTEQAEKN